MTGLNVVDGAVHPRILRFKLLVHAPTRNVSLYERIIFVTEIPYT